MSQTITPHPDLSEKKRVLLDLLRRERQQEKAERRAPIGPRADPASAPVAFAQGQLWFLDRLQPGSSAYNVPAAFRLRGRLDVEALEAALSAIVERHEALRTVFAEVDGAPVQRILSPEPVRLATVDLSSSAPGARDTELTRLVDEEARRPFDLTRGPLLRVRLIALGPDDHILQFTLHHIVCDGWSMGVLLRELSALYEASSTGRSANLPICRFSMATTPPGSGGAPRIRTSRRQSITSWRPCATLPRRYGCRSIDRDRPCRASAAAASTAHVDRD